MNPTKRVAKRSIVGTRVSSMSPDGMFHPGVIRGIKIRSTGEALYDVECGDGKKYQLPSDAIVGPGFRSVSSAHLKFNQQVFTTLNGREIRAIVQKHRKQTNEVLLKTTDVSETNFKRKLDDVRLLESRKSARFVDHGPDSLKLADVASAWSEAKKRPVSTSIEVPSAKTQKVQESEEPTMNEFMAAMVLTSLSGSPHIHRERNPSGDSVLSVGPMSPASSLSSGCGNASPSPSPSTNAHFTWDISRSTPSPASSTSDMESSPCPPFSTAQGSIPHSSALFSSSVDEGIDISSGSLPFSMDDAVPCSPSKKFKLSVKTSYKCTWQGCGKTLSTVQGIERHIRTIHLGKKEGEEYSDHEEEFYYTEIDTTVESVSDTLANMFTSSSPPAAFTFDASRLPHPHPEVTPQKPMETAPSSVPKSRQRARYLSGCSEPGSSPIMQHVDAAPSVGSLPNQPITMIGSSVGIPTSTPFTWCAASTPPPSFTFPTSSSSAHPTQTSHTHGRVRHKSAPLSTQSQPKIRSEGKKCRKVYGMENRDMWCTQCRWKKACVRFT